MYCVLEAKEKVKMPMYSHHRENLLTVSIPAANISTLSICASSSV